MTREEAQNGLQWTATNEIMLENRAIKLIDRIYDDFESRTCANCKHYKRISDYPNKCEYHETYNLIFTNDFGCNKFEQK